MKLSDFNILIYDKENICYKVGHLASITETNEPELVDITEVCENNYKTYKPSPTVDFQCTISNYEELNNIELDETTMKRIAKYNKEIDIKKLDEEIEEKKEKIQRLESILEDREKRVDMLKKYIAEIYDINIKEDEDDDYDEWD